MYMPPPPADSVNFPLPAHIQISQIDPIVLDSCFQSGFGKGPRVVLD